MKKIFYLPWGLLRLAILLPFSIIRWTVERFGFAMYYGCKGIYYVAKYPLLIIWWLIKKVCIVLTLPFRRKKIVEITEEQALPAYDLFDIEPREAITKIGSIVPREEDHDLRTFNILNNEGELFSIDTSVPGPFYGPVWTRILSCYEKRQTLCARLIRPIAGRENRINGYLVKIGNVNAFMPMRQALRRENQKSVNIRVAIAHIDLDNYRVTVSTRLAYDLLFSGKPMPQTGMTSKALYWDYDEHKVYFLLPGQYIGHTVYRETEVKIASRMGTLTECKVENIPQEFEAGVVLSKTKIAGPKKMKLVESLPDNDKISIVQSQKE